MASASTDRTRQNSIVSSEVVLPEVYQIPVWNPDRSGSYNCPQIWEVESYFLGLQQSGKVRVFQERTGGKGSQFHGVLIEYVDPGLRKDIRGTLKKRFFVGVPTCVLTSFREMYFEPYNFNRD